MFTRDTGHGAISQKGNYTHLVSFNSLGYYPMGEILLKAKRIEEDETFLTLLALSKVELRTYYNSGGNSNSVMEPYVAAFKASP